MASISATLCHSHNAFPEEEQIPSPPPPTPCNHSLSSGETDAFLSHLLTRLSMPAPTLAPVSPLRRKKKKKNTITVTPPVISLDEENRHLFLSAATELGFFHVINHDLSLNVHMFDPDAADEFVREMERVGLRVLQLLFEDMQIIGTEIRHLISVFASEMDGNGLMEKAINDCVLLQLMYEGRGKRVPSEVEDDKSGERVPVEACEDAVLVTLGEVAQVWSNGKFKKARILPQASPPSLHQREEPQNILITLLITVPECNSTNTAPVLIPTVQDTEISSGELHN